MCPFCARPLLSESAAAEMRCPGYDVYTLRHVGSLPESLITRLKNDDQFQGARYEIAVAAVFADYDAPSRDRSGRPPAKSAE